jgi:hypothetical protein
MVSRISELQQLTARIAVSESQRMYTSVRGCVVWARQSRMLVHNGADRERVEGLAFLDFLEALGRVADATSVISARELRELRYPSVRDFILATEAAVEGGGGGGSGGGVTLRGPSGRPHPARRASAEFAVPKSRPLHEKLAVVLDAVCQFMWHAGVGRAAGEAEAEFAPYSEEALSKRLAAANVALEAEDEKRRRAMGTSGAMLASFMHSR